MRGNHLSFIVFFDGFYKCPCTSVVFSWSWRQQWIQLWGLQCSWWYRYLPLHMIIVNPIKGLYVQNWTSTSIPMDIQCVITFLQAKLGRKKCISVWKEWKMSDLFTGTICNIWNLWQNLFCFVCVLPAVLDRSREQGCGKAKQTAFEQCISYFTAFWFIFVCNLPKVQLTVTVSSYFFLLFTSMHACLRASEHKSSCPSLCPVHHSI